MNSKSLDSKNPEFWQSIVLRRESWGEWAKKQVLMSKLRELLCISWGEMVKLSSSKSYQKRSKMGSRWESTFLMVRLLALVLLAVQLEPVELVPQIDVAVWMHERDSSLVSHRVFCESDVFTRDSPLHREYDEKIETDEFHLPENQGENGRISTISNLK